MRHLTGDVPARAALAVLLLSCAVVRAGTLETAPTGERLVHRFLSVALSPDGGRVASVEATRRSADGIRNCATS